MCDRLGPVAPSSQPRPYRPSRDSAPPTLTTPTLAPPTSAVSCRQICERKLNGRFSRRPQAEERLELMDCPDILPFIHPWGGAGGCGGGLPAATC